MKKTAGQYESEAIAASVRLKYRIFFIQKAYAGKTVYTIYRRIPGGKVSLIKQTNTAATLAGVFRKEETGATKKTNPSRRDDTEGAKALVTKFHGRAPDSDEYRKVPAPKMPKSMACIGQVSAIEYIAERDGKVFKFRHVFKAASRPDMTVSPDGKLAALLTGAWFFGPDGFEDLKP